MFPGFLGLVATYSLLTGLGLVNTFTGLILAYSGGAIAFGTWIYKGYVEGLPASLEEAALVDGATRWTAFTRIVLPLSAPMLVFIFLLQFIGTYAEFLLANVILTGAENWNVGLGLRSFQAGSFGSSQYGVLSAAAVLGSLPIVALFYSFQQIFVSARWPAG
jgi:arabinogalactan oligomer/maltooligosaccharide transport system permease protein